MSRIILISGPTASGKSLYAIKLAKKISGEIINADSMQVYKHFQILTARPLKKDQKEIRHHLYGFVELNKNFSTGQWLKLAIKKIKEIQKKGKTPIFVGGTGLYFQSLLNGLAEVPKIPKKTKNKVRKLHEKLGQKNFYKALKKIDKKIKKNFDPQDSQRSIRAYEVKIHTKKSLYDWFKETKPTFKKNNFIKYYLIHEKKSLLKRIEKRVNLMFKKGAVDEVEKVKKQNISKDSSCNKIIGYMEIKNYLNGKLNLKDTKEKMIIKTRQYAKRQNTWYNSRMRDGEILKF